MIPSTLLSALRNYKWTSQAVHWLVVSSVCLLMLACAPAAVPAPAQPAVSETAPAELSTPLPAAVVDTSALAASLTASVPIRSEDGGEGFDGINVFPLTTPASMPALWAAHTYGIRPFDPIQNHFVALYTHENSTWDEVARLELECADYVGEESIEQAALSVDPIWLAVHGGAGAHSGCFDLLRWDGERFTIAVSNFNASPGAGSIEDVDGDGQPEVILNYTEPYVFCYACGVRLFMADILRWTGSELVSAELAPLADGADPAVRDLNNEAVTLAQASLFPQALALIEEAHNLAPENEIVYWNWQWIQLHAQNRLEYAAGGAYPLLGYVFYGDYAAAVEPMRAYAPAEIFSLESPLIVGTPAEGWTDALSQYLVQFASDALAVQPDLAPAYFLRGWGRFLADPGDASAVEDVMQAATLAPDDAFYQEAATFLQGAIGQPVPTPPARDLPAADMETVRFATGATTELLGVVFGAAGERQYELEIAQGQTLYVTPPAGVNAVLIAPTGQEVPSVAADGALQFKIPQTGIYTLGLRGSGSADVLLYIPPLPENALAPEPAVSEQVRFAPGTTGTTIETTLREGVPVGYVLNIAAGQHLFADVEGNGSFLLLDPAGRVVTPVVGGASNAEFVIPYSGDYTLLLQGSAPVTLHLEIPPQ